MVTLKYNVLNYFQDVASICKTFPGLCSVCAPGHASNPRYSSNGIPTMVTVPFLTVPNCFFVVP